MAAMLNVIFTLDYEIHGNGEGCPHELMVEPTRRLMDLFDEHGAKLTIMADVAEILKFKEYKDSASFNPDRDYYCKHCLLAFKDEDELGRCEQTEHLTHSHCVKHSP